MSPGEWVEIRAFRGPRRASVYREHALPEKAFARILGVGERAGLPLLSSLDPYVSHELDKSEAQKLADETTNIRAGAELPDLDPDLVAIAEVARWCAHASGESWMKIEER
jgi:hypothetical protein